MAVGDCFWRRMKKQIHQQQQQQQEMSHQMDNKGLKTPRLQQPISLASLSRPQIAVNGNWSTTNSSFNTAIHLAVIHFSYIFLVDDVFRDYKLINFSGVSCPEWVKLIITGCQQIDPGSFPGRVNSIFIVNFRFSALK